MKNGSIANVIKAWANQWSDSEGYLQTPNGSLYREKGIIYSWGSHFPLGVHIGRYALVNADRYSNSTAHHQSLVIRALAKAYRVEIPFSALSFMISGRKFETHKGYQFKENELADHISILDHEDDKWYPNGGINLDGSPSMSHILGGCLFKYDDRYLYSGIDETGIGRNMYFMTEIAGKPETCAEALEMMKPQEVKDAESKGQEVLRQGEWFFIKLNIETEASPFSTLTKFEKNYHLKGNDGDTGHHFASEGVEIAGVQYVKGIIKHEERDHKQLKLYDDVKDKKWYTAHRNIQVQSFSAFGNVD